MTIQHHPGELTLMDYANGKLDLGRHLVVETHLEHCAACRAVLALSDHMGGQFLDAVKPVAMGKDALARTFARIEAASDDQQVRGSDRIALGKWKRIGPRIELRAVTLPEATDTRVFMLRAKGGTWLPKHSHTDLEWTCVLEGAFTHEGGTYGPGDFDEADETMRHNPFVEDGAPCVCIVALKGNVKFESWIGRMIQPLVRL